MDGRELFERVVSTVQETYLKIGDMSGSISLYYPFEGAAETLIGDFVRASSGFPGISVETLYQRIRVTVPEEVCRKMCWMPMDPDMRAMVELTRDQSSPEAFRDRLLKRNPKARMVPSPYPEFDWIVVFPKDGSDIYCLAEEMGRLTYHRFSPEEFGRFGYEVPE